MGYHTKAIRKLKKMMQSAPTLQKIDYNCGKPVIVTVDTSPTGIGRESVGQLDKMMKPETDMRQDLELKC